MSLLPKPGSYVEDKHISTSDDTIWMEFNSLMVNDTWILVPCPHDTDPIGNKQVYKNKVKSNGLLDKYKVRVRARA